MKVRIRPSRAVPKRNPSTSVYVRVGVDRLREILTWRLFAADRHAATAMHVGQYDVAGMSKADCIRKLDAMDAALPNIKSREWSPFVNGISYSALSDWLKCRELARLSFLGWKRIARMPSADYGVMFHSALEQIYTRFRDTGPYVPEESYLEAVADQVTEEFHEKLVAEGAPERSIQDVERHGGCLLALLPEYCLFWRDDFTGRYEWQELEGRVYSRCPVDAPVYFKGFIDATYLLNNRLWVMDTKTRGRIDESTISSAVNIDLQLTLYSWMVWRETGVAPAGVRYNVIRNPQLKKGKGSLADYVGRVRADAKKRPEFYFLRFEVPLCGTTELEAFEKNAAGMVDEFLSWFYGTGTHYMSTSACASGKWPCDFLAWCGDGAREDAYRNYNDER